MKENIGSESTLLDMYKAREDVVDGGGMSSTFNPKQASKKNKLKVVVSYHIEPRREFIIGKP